MTSDTRGDQTVVLLHGWPGLPSDYDAVIAGLPDVSVITPDLLGMGAGFDGIPSAPASTAETHAERVLAELNDAGVAGNVVIVGYDIGSRIAQAALRISPDLFDGAVLTPGYPGIGDRAASPALASVFWYQHFHRDPVAAQLIDGDERAVRTYLTHIWNSWRAEPTPPPHLDEIIAAYARPERSPPACSGTSPTAATPARPHPSPFRRRCCGRGRTRCSPSNGATLWTTTSPTPASTSPTDAGISSPSNAPTP